MQIRSYQDLEVWQRAMELALICYRATEQFPRSETFGLASQLQRAAVSVPANIAEGRGRRSTGDFLRFLSIASGSLAETETHLLLAHRLGYLPEERLQSLLVLTARIGRMLNGLRRSLRCSE